MIKMNLKKKCLNCNFQHLVILTNILKFQSHELTKKDKEEVFRQFNLYKKAEKTMLRDHLRFLDTISGLILSLIQNSIEVLKVANEADTSFNDFCVELIKQLKIIKGAQTVKD